LVTAYQTCEPFRNAVNAIGQALYNFLKPAIDAICGALTWFWNNILKPLADFIVAVLVANINMWSAAFKALGDVWGAVTSAISGFWNTYIKPVADFIVGVIIAGIQGWMNVFKALGDVWGAVCSAIGGFWNTLH